MNWEQLMGKIREGLGESGARIRVVGELLTQVDKTDDDLNAVEIDVSLTLLTLAMSDLHSTVEMLAIGVDAVVATLHQGTVLQEVKGE